MGEGMNYVYVVVRSEGTVPWACDIAIYAEKKDAQARAKALGGKVPKYLQKSNWIRYRVSKRQLL